MVKHYKISTLDSLEEASGLDSCPTYVDSRDYATLEAELDITRKAVDALQAQRVAANEKLLKAKQERDEALARLKDYLYTTQSILKKE